MRLLEMLKMSLSQALGNTQEAVGLQDKKDLIINNNCIKMLTSKQSPTGSQVAFIADNVSLRLLNHRITA